MLNFENVLKQEKSYEFLKDWNFILYEDFVKNFNVSFKDIIEKN